MSRAPYASIGLRRHGNAQETVSWAFFATSMIFWIVAVTRDEPIMPIANYGDAVVQYPAEWWAGSIMLATSAHLLGIIINGRWRWSPALRFCGSLWQVGTLFAFVFGAMTAEYDFFAIPCGVFAVVYVWFLGWNTVDLARVVRDGAW
ncbi:MAG: hypothetical protein OEZ19_00110 [Paracoccaceae bacterium]|nr:hypothetical protein [Paracoccaceae bacterium]